MNHETCSSLKPQQKGKSSDEKAMRALLKRSVYTFNVLHFSHGQEVGSDIKI